MLYPTTKIQTMDVSSEEVETIDVASFFRKYFHKAENRGSIHQIHFERQGMIVKIKDHTGWTDIRYMNMVPNNVWTKVCVADKEIIVNPYTFIPLYDDTQPEKGFHGEIKYPYILCHPEKIKDNKGKIKILKGIKDDREIEFGDGIIDFFYSKKLNVKPPFTDGYNIVTKSRFFTAEGIHLFGSEELTFEEYNKWYPSEKDKDVTAKKEDTPQTKYDTPTELDLNKPPFSLIPTWEQMNGKSILNDKES